MAFIPGSNVLQLEVRGTYFGQEVEIVQYFQCSSAINSTNTEALFDFYEDTFLPDLLASCSSSLAIDELYGTDLTTVSSPTYSRVFSPAINGGNSEAAGLPANIAACISFRSSNRGRSSRGRNYVPAMVENQVGGNEISTGVLNALVAAYELLLGGGDFPVAWLWGVFSRYFELAPRTTGLFQEIVDVLSTDLTVDSQRGRLRGD